MQLFINIDSGESEIPYDHSYQLYSGLLSLIDKQNPQLAKNLHAYSSNLMFSLSQLMPGGKKSFTKLGFRGERFLFIISSIDDELIENIEQCFLSADGIELFNSNFKIHSVVHKVIQPSSEIENLKTRSPIIIKQEEKYLFNAPDDQVKIAIQSSIDRKYRKVLGSKPNIHFLKVTDIKWKIVAIKGIKLPAFMASFIIGADLDVIRFVLSTGIGSKNKLGFGFVEEEKRGDSHGL
ncbi:MAG: CRISPR-associated endoribonuclease Cas6 [Thermoplasmatales archaeon]